MKMKQPLTNQAFHLIVLLSCFASVNLLAQNNTSEQIAPELVGKWCFINLSSNTADEITNSCITLNADGTFEAVLDRKMIPNGTSFGNLQDSDYGKWWVSNGRIFYHSNSNGQGSFAFQKMNHPRLENTPMIVCSGITFATASNHEPW
ncbi:MAG TPA: hypothetical protein VGQ59_00125 [Cyclobacteriaceae bacterium]|nr:hypothetical protein [Cyclobacteriaceae bacterium]